jgi:pimeloyl-ACP methyl ester carboxylesterase
MREQLLAFIARLPLLRIALYSLLSTRLVLRASIARHYQSVNAHMCNEIVHHRFAAAHQLHAYRAALAYLAGKLDTRDITASLESLQQPTLQFGEVLRSNSMLQGEQGRQEQATSTTARTQVVLLSDTGTSPHEEQPEAVVRRILEWQRSLGEPEEEIEAYCVKCKQKCIIAGPQPTVMKNGRNAVEGTCSVCGTHLFRFVAS